MLMPRRTTIKKHDDVVESDTEPFMKGRNNTNACGLVG
jgi:hypothetical protein